MMTNYILKSAEMDRVADAFSGYIHRHPSLDLVWSEKAGYVLMTINPDKQRGEDYCSFRTAHDLAFRLFSEVVTDVVLECEDCDDVSSMDDEGREEVKQRWAPFLEMLPESALPASFRTEKHTNTYTCKIVYGKPHSNKPKQVPDKCLASL